MTNTQVRTSDLAETANAQMRVLGIRGKVGQENAQAMYLAGAMRALELAGLTAPHTHATIAVLASCGRFDEACRTLDQCAAGYAGESE